MQDRAKSSISSFESQGDNGSHSNEDLLFYPAYCYNASPTWFTWVKLTTDDIHNRLRVRSEFQTVPAFTTTSNSWFQHQSLLLFYLNHPIQFVQLVGVVVTFEEYFEKYWVFTLDDSSGATIEVNCRKPETNIVPIPDGGAPHHRPEKDTDAEARYEAMRKLDIGIAVQVKGHITTFRDIRQIQLDRICILNDTNHELRLVAARTEFRQNVLGSPWILSSAKQRRLQRDAKGEQDLHLKNRQRRHQVEEMKLDREKRHAEKIAKRYERDEWKRQAMAQKAREAGQSLNK